MNIKNYILKKLIYYGIIPHSLRLKKITKGWGVMYFNMYNLMLNKYDIQGIKNLNDMMYNWGLKQGPEILKELNFDENLEEYAYVLLTAHRLSGLKSKIVEKSDNKIIIHVSHCQWWNNIEGWTPRTCNSVAHYETGLLKGILPNAQHQYTKKRSLGNEVCELIISNNHNNNRN